MANRSIDIKLEFPVTWENKEVDTITLRRPKGRDMRHLPTGDDTGVEEMFPFLALLMSVGGRPITEEFIEEMDAADINKMSEQTMAFLDRKPGKGSPRRKPGAR